MTDLVIYMSAAVTVRHTNTLGVLYLNFLWRSLVGGVDSVVASGSIIHDRS